MNWTQPCDRIADSRLPSYAGCDSRSKPWVLAATILGSSMAFIDGTVVNVALPALQKSLQATVVDVQWVVEAYSLLLAALLLVGGSLGDLYGRKRIYLAGVSLFAVSSAWCGLSSSVGQLIVARAVQGIGAAMLVPGSLAIISASFEKSERGKAIGTWSGFTSMTTALGPVLGGWLIEHASWRWAFFINLPLAAAVLGLTVWRVSESRNIHADRRPDWAGAALATAGLCSITFATIESSPKGWSDPWVLGAFGVGLAALGAFLIVETRRRAPLMPLGLFRDLNFAGTNLLTLLLYGALSGMFFFFPLNLIQVQGYTATEAGAASLPFIILMFLLSRWAGALVDRFGARSPLIAGPLVAAAGFGLFAVPSIGGSYWSTFFPAILVLGLGMVTTVAPLTATVMNSVPQERAGIASGINNAVSRVAAVLAIAVLGLLMLSGFERQLAARLESIALNPATRSELEAQRFKLAAIEIPQDVSQDIRDAVRNAVAESFVAGFRLVMMTAAGLALASAGTAWLLIRSGGEAGEGEPVPSSEFFEGGDAAPLKK